MSSKAERTEHSGPKKGGGAYYGRKRWAKRDSAVTRRRNGRREIATQEHEGRQ